MSPHVSVLLSEVLQSFEQTSLQIFVDGTLGAGGHSYHILLAHPEIQKLIGIDQDPVAREIAQKRLDIWQSKLTVVAGNFSQMSKHLNSLNIKKVDGILLDLGVSSMQFDTPEKGFSFMHDGPLDMRMDPTATLTAAEIINTWTEHDIARVFRDYGEEKQWRQAARVVVAAREQQPIITTKQLADVLRPIFCWKKKGINPLTLIFQGLRICVNAELEVLETVIPEAIELLNSGGRLAVISFHSLEDRIVKNAFRFAADDKMSTSGIGGMFLDKDPIVKLITRKPIVPSDEEIETNPRSRSAKLRVIEKI
jgi:16S rRNA (cytosine1402-N4)-methyltransferase